jgi:hypothetical protein
LAIAVILIAVLIGVALAAPLVPSLSTNNTINLGFEGAKVVCYGACFTNSADPSKVYAIGSVTDGTVLTHSDQAFGSAPSTTYNMPISWDSATGPTQQDLIAKSGDTQLPNLCTVVESNIPLADLNAQGQPLSSQLLPGTSSSDGTGGSESAQELTYWNVQQTLNSQGQITGYKVTQQTLLLVQADFALDIWLLPSTANHDSAASGWQEGQWSNVELWYEIMWNQWENSLGSTSVLTSSDEQAALAQLTGSNAPGASSATLTSVSPFSFGGGVPLTCWVQNIAMPVSGPGGTIYDIYSANVASGSSSSGSTSTTAKTLEDMGLSQTVIEDIEAHADGLAPNEQGQFIALYTQPSDIYSYTTASLGASNPQNVANGQVPSASTEYPDQYFKIGITGFGSDAEASGWPIANWKVYYPAVAYDVHLVFAVYGTHTYLWTTQTAQQNNYPGFTNETTQIVSNTNTFNTWLSNVGKWFSGSGPWLILLYVIIVVAIVIIVIKVLPKKTTQPPGGNKK